MELKADKKVIVERNNKVVYDNGDTVVKVFSGSKPSADILNEALNLTRAEQAGINVPALAEISKVGNCWAISTRKVEGRTIRQLIEEHPEKEDEYLNKFVDIELAIHAHKSPLLTRQKDKFTRMINSIPDILDEATRYELLLKLDGMKPHTKVCHGDFVPSNVILAEDGAPVILDWAHATQGNGAADCATTYLHLLLHGDEELAEKYINLYCTKQGCTRQYVNEWLGIIAAAELARGRVKETEFLLKWVNVFDAM